jgi:hypothetical protein
VCFGAPPGDDSANFNDVEARQQIRTHMDAQYLILGGAYEVIDD